jgi:hypothetical protein
MSCLTVILTLHLHSKIEPPITRADEATKPVATVAAVKQFMFRTKKTEKLFLEVVNNINKTERTLFCWHSSLLLLFLITNDWKEK